MGVHKLISFDKALSALTEYKYSITQILRLYPHDKVESMSPIGSSQQLRAVGSLLVLLN